MIGQVVFEVLGGGVAQNYHKITAPLSFGRLLGNLQAAKFWTVEQPMRKFACSQRDVRPILDWKNADLRSQERRSQIARTPILLS